MSKQLKIGLGISLLFHALLLGGSFFLKSAMPLPVYTTVQVLSKETKVEKKTQTAAPPPTQKIQKAVVENSPFSKSIAPKTVSPNASERPHLQVTASSQPSHPGNLMASPDYGKNPIPDYPEDSRNNGIEGVVLLQVHVSEIGNPLQVSLKKTSGHRDLDIAAIQAVRHWQFYPARLNGKPVDSFAEVPVQFRLK